MNAGKGALATYEGSLGLGGEAGRAAATGAFQASPGYEWRVNQATDGLARKASSLGALGGGNTMAAISDRAGQMANQEYSGWQDRLNGLSTQGLQGAGAQAGLYKGLGDLGVQLGRDEAGLHGQYAGQRSGVYTGTAGQEASALGNYTGMHANNVQNLSNTVVGAGTGAMMAGQNAAQNRLNFGMQGLSLGASLLGGGMGGAGGLGGLFGANGAASNALGAAVGFEPFGSGRWY